MNPGQSLSTNHLPNFLFGFFNDFSLPFSSVKSLKTLYQIQQCLLSGKLLVQDSRLELLGWSFEAETFRLDLLELLADVHRQTDRVRVDWADPVALVRDALD